MRCIVSQLIRDQRLFIIEKIKLSSPKTKELLQLLSSYKAETKLIIVHAVDLNLDLASRNIANLKITTPQQADPVSLVGYEKTFVTEDAMSKLEELYT
jgi:large subunit ribosomal protein L4